MFVQLALAFLESSDEGVEGGRGVDDLNLILLEQSCEFLLK